VPRATCRLSAGDGEIGGSRVGRFRSAKAQQRVGHDFLGCSARFGDVCGRSGNAAWVGVRWGIPKRMREPFWPWGLVSVVVLAALSMYSNVVRPPVVQHRWPNACRVVVPHACPLSLRGLFIGLLGNR